MSEASVDDALAAEQPGILEGLNVHYDDSTLLIGRILGGRPSATKVQATAVQAHGVSLIVTDAEGDHRVELPFEAPITEPDRVWTSLFALVVAARERSGEEGQTSAERVIAQSASYRTFFTMVSAVTDVAPGMREVTFAGGDLAKDFAPVGPDTFLYLLLPPRGRRELTIGPDFTWEGVAEMAPEEQPVGAYYTLRRWRPEAAELDVWMVRHGDEGAASAWAERAEVGDPVALWGPRTSWAPPPGTDRYLLVADETGLPATAAILESLPDGVQVHVLAEVADEAHRPPLPDRRDADVTWLHRNGAAPGTTNLLLDAVSALTPLAGAAYVWGGAESRTMAKVRRLVRHGWGLPRTRVDLIAYWRRADDPGDGAAAADDE